jgi:Phage tail tube protein
MVAGYDRASLLKEATFSTKPAITNAEWLEFLTESIQGKHATDLQQGSYYETPAREGLGRYSWGGALTMKLGAENGITRIARNLFGLPTTSTQDGVNPRWLHVFNTTNSIGYTDSLSLSLTRTTGAGQKQFDYVGGAISKWGLEAVVDQDVRQTIDFIGDKESFTGTLDTEVTPDALEYFRHHDTVWQIGGTPTTDLDVSAWSVQFESAAEIVPAVNSRFGRRVFRGGLNITGRVDRDFVDTVFYSRFLGSDAATAPQTTLTAQNVSIILTGPSLGGAGNYTNYKLQLEFPRVKFFETTANLSGRDRITQGVPFVVLRDPAVAYAARITLTNSRSATFVAG